jgi:hypothetical protein
MQVYSVKRVMSVLVAMTLLPGMLLLTGCMFAGPCPQTIGKSTSHFITADLPASTELPAGKVAYIESTLSHNLDATILETTDDEFRSLKKQPESIFSSLSFLIDGRVPIHKYFYFPSSCRYIIFSIFRI